MFITLSGLLLATISARALADDSGAVHTLTVPPWEQPYFAYTAVAAFTAFMLGKMYDFKSTRAFFAEYWPELDNGTVFFLVDAFLYVGIGSLMGTAFFEPRTPHAAMLAGVMWPSLFEQVTRHVGLPRFSGRGLTVSTRPEQGSCAQPCWG